MPVALVTGSSKGIGRVIALQLAQDGFDVVINDLPNLTDKLQEVEKEILALDRKCLVIVADVTNEEEVKGMVEKTVTQLGGLDVMVANAGILIIEPLVDHTVEIFNKTLSVNVLGTFLCFKYASLEMIKQGRGGRLIAASSIHGKEVTRPGAAAYAASKFAVRGIMQTAAVELGSHGITANAYAPGITDTDMLVYIRSKNPGPSVAVNHYSSGTPLQRIGQPEDVAAVVSFLASPAASFVTGQTIGVNGGYLLS